MTDPLNNPILTVGNREQIVWKVHGRQRVITSGVEWVGQITEDAETVVGDRRYLAVPWFRGKIDHALVAMAKWYSAKVAVYCADEALQLHGGYGYIDEYKVQRLYRDAKILEIYEGTKEIEKTIIARSLL